MLPERKFEFFSYIKYNLDSILLQRNYNRDGFNLNPYDYQKYLTIAIFDALNYFKIDLETFWRYVNSWPDYEKDLWVTSGSPSKFYKNWNNNISIINSCANIANQSLYLNLYHIAAYFLSKRGNYIDYGCGTATFSLGLKISNNLKGNLLLLDVSNDVQNFINYRINKYGLNHDVEFKDVLKFNGFVTSDGLLCIDVLEHIENSSEIFIEKISPMIKKGGLLIMRAPWRGHLTHLDSAAENFYHCGGRDFLSKHYREIMRFDVIDIGCVYKKL